MKAPNLQWLLALLAGSSAFAQGPDQHGDRRPPPIPSLFAALDTDHDHVISKKEQRHADRSIQRLDQNRDGEITIDELRMLPPPPPQDDDLEKPKHPIPPVITALDQDQDGSISAEELENATESLKQLDHDGDGELSPAELRPHGPPPEGPPPEGDPDETPEGAPPTEDEGTAE
jgi:Ca2+-binding EF-hand superfamily protein